MKDSQGVIQEVSAEDMQKIDDLLLNKQITWPPRMAVHDDMLDALTFAYTYGMAIVRPENCAGIIINDC